MLSTVGGRFFEECSKIPPASLEWRPFWATADLSGPSRAHGMAGKIFWLEIAVRNHLRMRALMALTGLVCRTPGKQRRLARSALRRPPVNHMTRRAFSCKAMLRE